jgi:CelD/BcsL family acetyltransferase involved in cellulose biosynthesis
VRAQIIRNEAELFGLEDDWRDLSRRAAATPFLAPAWLLPWWRTFHPGRLLTAAVWDGASLVALAPLYVAESPGGRRLLPLGIAASDYLDVLIDPACPGARAAMVDAIDAEEDWDTWSLEELPPGAAALAIPCAEHWHEERERQSACPVLRLPDSVAHLGESVPPIKLRKVRTARNRASRHGGFEIESIGLPEAQRFLQELYRLHGARWASRGEGGALRDASVHRFHAAAAPALLAAGLARFFVLALEGHVVAAYYGLCDGRRAFGYLTGFDPAHAFESPGTVILEHAIESAVAEGCAEFHFLRGRESYKYDWGAEDVWSVRRTFVREVAHA